MDDRRATVIKLEKAQVYAGNGQYTETMLETERFKLETENASTALAWARTKRKPWEGFVIELNGKVVGCEVPS